MNANPSSIAQVFEGQKQYVIPVFQRTYEWGKNRWESIWQDILAISEENDSNLTHFIGPMVTIPNAIPKSKLLNGWQNWLPDLLIYGKG